MSKTQAPQNTSYNAVIVGGEIMGGLGRVAFSDDKDFQGTTLVVEKDANNELSSTMHKNSCMSQQISTQLDVQISQFDAGFVETCRVMRETVTACRT